MKIDSPSNSDWEIFLVWAKQEGWRVPAREVELFRGPLAKGAFVLRGSGKPLGFVTTVRHERSGWIGNLLVDPDGRGRGAGTLLFEHAVQELHHRGCGSLWLTASALGRPIYQKRGFRPVDGVVRWVRPAVAGGQGRAAPVEVGALYAADANAWRESRQGMLALIAEGGQVFTRGGTAALLQQGGGIQVFGPWSSAGCCPRENRQIVAAILDAAAPGSEVVADVLESSPMQVLLAAAGFERRGRCDLMLRGAVGADLSAVVALASLGSMG